LHAHSHLRQPMQAVVSSSTPFQSGETGLLCVEALTFWEAPATPIVPVAAVNFKKFLLVKSKLFPPIANLKTWIAN